MHVVVVVGELHHDPARAAQVQPIVAIYDPRTTRANPNGQGQVRDQFPGNIVPTGDPLRSLVASRIVPMMVRPDLPDRTSSNVRGNPAGDQTWEIDARNIMFRVDHNFSENDRVFARYSFSDNDKLRPPPFEGDADGGGFAEGTETVRVHGLALSHTHVFSSSLINEARFGFGRERTYRLQPNGDDTSDIPARYGILGIPQLPGNGGLPRLEAAGLRRRSRTMATPPASRSTPMTR